MGSGFKLNLKLGFSIQPRLSSNWPSSSYSSFRGKDINYDTTRVSLSSVLSMESETFYSDHMSGNTCSSSSGILDSDYPETEDIKRKRSRAGLHVDKYTFFTSFQAKKISKYSLLLENLVILEDTFSDSDVITLERDILVQLEKIGALKLFDISSSEILQSAFSLDPIKEETDKPFVPSTKKVERKLRRERASKKIDNLCTVEYPSSRKNSRNVNFSAKRSSYSGGRRLKITRNEAELSTGVKMVANLERVRMKVEEETGDEVSFNSWAAAVGVDKKVLLQNLQFGWCCKDELLISTRSLVLYLARNYSGQGIAFEDIIQAGNFGVLQGAERFDESRGYKFSTYVQYWIRKSMSMLMSRHARGIRIPFALSKAINKIQKARKALHGNPDDDKIAIFTGLSLAKIASASKCLRVVGSIDQKIGYYMNTKFLELTPDTTMKTPEEIVMKEHMVKAIHGLMDELDTRERKVLELRFGFGGYQRKSLEEIGRFFGVSKEWIRKIERKALTKLKLKDDEIVQSLRHFL